MIQIRGYIEMFPEEQFIEGGSVRINNEVVAIIFSDSCQ